MRIRSDFSIIAVCVIIDGLISKQTLKSLTVTPFIRDSFENYQKSACGITLDIGRQRINQKELLSLIDFVKEKKMIESFNEMRKGKIVNASEHRSALHTSLRDLLRMPLMPQKFTRHWKLSASLLKMSATGNGAAVQATELPMSSISV